MKTLDCETVESAFASIEEILRIERPVLEDILGDLDLDSARRKDPGKADSRILLDAVLKRAGAGDRGFDRTCWFHFTRCHPGNSFSRGLLPLKDALPFLWGFLLMLLPRDFSLEAWYRFAGDPVSAPYRRKWNDPGRSGPFALLSRDAGTRAGEFGLPDLFAGPAVVQDICCAFRKEHGVDLLRAYRENTRPCVVKFADNRTAPGHIEAALQYLYCHMHILQFGSEREFDFDARGEAIPPDRILKVEFLKDALC